VRNLTFLTIFQIGGKTVRHCGNQYSLLFDYYSLGGDTAMPRGLHARLCHTSS